MSLFDIIYTYVLPIIVDTSTISENCLIVMRDICSYVALYICLQLFLLIPFKLLKRVARLK